MFWLDRFAGSPQRACRVTALSVACCLFVPFFLFSISSSAYSDVPKIIAKESRQIALTDKERAWLEKHPTIRLSYDGYFPPYSFYNDAGELEGLSVDVFRIISNQLGITLDVYPKATWKELYAAAQKREVDAVATMVKRPEREALFAFTKPYVFKSLVIMTREDDSRIERRDDLGGMSVALVKEYQYVKRVLEEYPSVKPYYVDTMLDGLNAVAIGKADAVITFLGGGHYLRTKYTIPNLKFSAIYDRESSLESIAVRGDWPELAAIFDKALKSIPESEMLELQTKWLPVGFLESNIEVELTEQERAWIKEHPVIHLGVDPEFAPFEYIDEETYSGITSDYIKLLNRRLGLNMQIARGLTWKDAVERVKKKELDILPCVGLTEERKAFLNYTRPYISFNRVIITRTDTPFITGPNDIRDRRVAVQLNSSHEGYLKDHTDITPIAYSTLKESLLALSNGKVDAFVGNVASSTYWIRKMNLTNLKVAAPVSQDLQSLHFAVRNDWPELTGILQKGLDSVSDKQRRKISEKWLLLEYEPVVDYWLVGQVSVGFVLLLIMISLWNVQISRQKKVIQLAENEALIANEKLTRMHDELEQLVEIRTSELRESEKNFRQAQKMEALGTLVGGIAHDFNNILAGMLGSIYLVQSSPDDRYLAKKSLSNAYDLGFRAADMIKQLLAFAREEKVSKSMLPLTPFFKEAVKLIRTGVEESIKFNSSSDVDDLFVNANSTQLQQLLFNLVNNARDAVVNLECPEINIRLNQFEADSVFIKQHPEITHAHFAVMEVQDNGEGIPEENLERLFDPFFTTKEVGKGTGLGLAMVYGSVQDHGGILEVESSPGHGSRFKVYLPLEEGGMSQVDQGGDDIHRGCGETILLVDDDLRLQDTTKAILIDLGYQVLVANDGREAVNLYTANPNKVDLVIMDVVMPNMNGPDAAKEMRQVDQKVKVVYLTGYDSKGILTSRLKQSPEVLLNKPCPISYLSRIIREQFD